MELQGKIGLCPECRKPLAEVVFQGLTVALCYQCRGFLVASEKVDDPRVFEFAETEIPGNNPLKKQDGKPLLCPHDGSPLLLRNCDTHPGLFISLCPECKRGWFEAKGLSLSVKQQEQRRVTKRSLLIGLFIAVSIPAIIFLFRWILSALLGRFDAETLKGICIASSTLMFFSLCGLSLSSQGMDSCASGGCCASRRGIALGAAFLGENFWKIITAFLFFASLLFFLAWVQHPHKAKGPDEPFFSRQGSSRLGTADELQSMADDKKSEGKYDEAEVIYKRALTLYERLPKENAHEIARTLLDMGLLYRETSRPQDAESCDKRSLAIFEKLSLENQSEHRPIRMVAVVLREMAALYRDTNRPGEADKLEQQSKRILDENADLIARQDAEVDRRLNASNPTRENKK